MRASETWLVMLWLVAAAGCDSAAPYRAVVREQIAAYEEVESILAGVTDAASMQAAAPKLAERGDAIEATTEKARRLGRPTPDVMERIRPDIEKLAALRGRYDSQVRRIVALPGGADFLTKIKESGVAP